MQAFADFSSSLVGGLQLLALALVLGSLALMTYTGRPYYSALLYNILAVSAALFVLGNGNNDRFEVNHNRGKLFLHGSTQSLARTVDPLASWVGIDAKDIVLISEYAGGGFGSKGAGAVSMVSTSAKPVVPSGFVTVTRYVPSAAE